MYTKSFQMFIVAGWLFAIFRFSFSFFNVFLVSCYVKQFLGSLYLFWFFIRALCSTWKKLKFKQ